MSSSFTGIDIGAESVKFVQARKGKNGRLILTNAGLAAIGDMSALPEGDARSEAMAAVLKGLMTERRARLRRAHTSVSGKKVITRYAHVPPMPPWRLEKVMAFEVQNEVPGGEPVASDFKLLDLPNKAQEFTVLIGMAKEDVIAAQKRIFDSVGVSVADITLGCLPTLHSFIYSKKAELDAMPGPCAVINIGAEKMEIVIVSGSKLYFARSVTPGGSAFTEGIQQELGIPFENAEKVKRARGRIGPATPAPEGEVPVIPIGEEVPVLPSSPDDEDTALGSDEDDEVIPAMVKEPPQPDGRPGDPISRVMESAAHSLVNSIQSCLRYAKAQTKLVDLQVSRIYITGGSAALPGLARHVQERLGIQTFLFDPLENVDISAMAPPAREVVEANRYAFVTAIGLAASQVLPDALTMSLLPQAEKRLRTYRKHAFFAVAAGVLFAAAVAMMFASSVNATKRLGSYTNQQDSRLKRAKSMEGDLERLKAENADYSEKAGKLRELILRNRNYLSGLAMLKLHVPREVELSSLRTYPSTSAPEHKTLEAKPNKYGKTKELEKQPRMLYLAGKVAESVDLKRSREIVEKLADDLKKDGPLGRKVFSQSKITKAIAESDRERLFEIELVLNED